MTYVYTNVHYRYFVFLIVSELASDITNHFVIIIFMFYHMELNLVWIMDKYFLFYDLYQVKVISI